MEDEMDMNNYERYKCEWEGWNGMSSRGESAGGKIMMHIIVH